MKQHATETQNIFLHSRNERSYTFPVKVKMRRFNYTNLWVYRNLSCLATWHQRSYQIALKQGNQNPKNNMINYKLSFASTAHVTQWSNYLTQRAEILTQRSNLTPQRATNTVNDLRSVMSVLPKSLRHQASWLNSLLSFFTATSKLQSAVYSEWK